MAIIPIMINGLPGNVATALVRDVAARGEFELIGCSLTGPEIAADSADVDGRSIELVHAGRRGEVVEDLKNRYPGFISVDFTHPTAVNANARFYCDHGLPFVMGTTGGDREDLVKTVRGSKTAAVIAPNMAKQIVGFQAMLAYAAEQFPGLFDGYRMTVAESHQRGKADTSGTAKAVVQSFNRLGIPFTPDQIHKERDPEVQKTAWGIPEAYLGGHGWHTYRLESADGTVSFSFSHNVNGREVYVHGTLDAVRYLHAQIARGAGSGRVFSMIDVLKG
jgi:4-hydroxy-tetrahydrodipicolinate reductase